MFSLKSRKKFLVSLRACSLENSSCLKLRTYLHTRTRELKINTQHDAELARETFCLRMREKVRKFDLCFTTFVHALRERAVFGAEEFDNRTF